MKSKRFTIIDHIRAAGTFGVLADDLVALVGAADRWSLNVMTSKLRYAKAPAFVCRYTGEGYRYWMAEHAPKRLPPGAVPAWKERKDEQLLSLVREAGKPGICVRTLEQSFSRSVYIEAVARLRRKHLVWASRGTPGTPARYFASADWLDVYLGKLKAARRASGGLVDPKLQRAAAHWTSLPSKSAPQPVVIPAGLKKKVLPGVLGYDPRYQVDPNMHVLGGFASLGPGRYLDGSV